MDDILSRQLTFWKNSSLKPAQMDSPASAADSSDQSSAFAAELHDTQSFKATTSSLSAWSSTHSVTNYSRDAATVYVASSPADVAKARPSGAGSGHATGFDSSPYSAVYSRLAAASGHLYDAWPLHLHAAAQAAGYTVGRAPSTGSASQIPSSTSSTNKAAMIYGGSQSGASGGLWDVYAAPCGAGGWISDLSSASGTFPSPISGGFGPVSAGDYPMFSSLHQSGISPFIQLSQNAVADSHLGGFVAYKTDPYADHGPGTWQQCWTVFRRYSPAGPRR